MTLIANIEIVQQPGNHVISRQVHNARERLNLALPPDQAIIDDEEPWVGFTYKPGPVDDDRYTKDLEDMLRRIVAILEESRILECNCKACSVHATELAEAKTLLESTGYTDDF